MRSAQKARRSTSRKTSRTRRPRRRSGRTALEVVTSILAREPGRVMTTQELTDAALATGELDHLKHPAQVVSAAITGEIRRDPHGTNFQKAGHGRYRWTPRPVSPQAATLAVDELMARARIKRMDEPVRALVQEIEEGDVIPNPPWQRGYIWDPRKASLLVESALMEFLIPIVYLAEGDNGVREVVDGQQRVVSFQRFLRNDFALRGLRYRRDLNGKRFAELPKDCQRQLKAHPIVTATICDTDDRVKFEYFCRLNQASTTLRPQELRNGAFRGPYNDLLRDLACDQRLLDLCFGGAEPVRFENVELVLRFAAFYHQGFDAAYKGRLGAFLDAEMAAGSSYSDKQLAGLRAAYDKALYLAGEVFGEHAFRRFVPGGSRDANGTWTPTVNRLLFDVVMVGFARHPSSQVVARKDAITEALLSMMTTNRAFSETLQGGGNMSVQRVRSRFVTWLAELDQIVGKCEPRAFTASQKRTLWRTSSECALCATPIRSIDDAHVHHVEHYWRGGLTTMSNAQLTHRACNLAEGGGRSGRESA